MEQTPKEVGHSLPLNESQLKRLSESASAKESSRQSLATDSSKANTPEQTDPIMDRLWLRMTEIFGHKWTSQYGDSPLATWAKGLGKLSASEIAIGVNKCAASTMPWPPSLPDFRAMCEPSPTDFGLPDDEKAYREACRNAHPCMAGITKWSHNAVYHAAVETGFYNLNTLPMPTSRKLFERNYAIAVRMVMAGEPLKSMPLALPETVSARTTPEVGQSALAKIRNQLRGAQDDSSG